MDLLGEAGLMLASFLFFWMVLSWWQQMRQEKGMPPGPMPLPVIGNLLQLSPKNMYRSLMKLSETYGPVFTIHLGSRPVVVLRGYEAVKEALVDQAEAFSGRGKVATFDWLFQGYGLPFCTGPRAKELRRFSIMTLRNFGMGKRSMEDRILEEIHVLLDVFQSMQKVYTSGRKRNYYSKLLLLYQNTFLAAWRCLWWKLTFAFRTPGFQCAPSPFVDTCTAPRWLWPGGLLSSLLFSRFFPFLLSSSIFVQGTDVHPLLGSVLKDPKHFERPEAFDPQHFLDENGQLKMNDAFMPFSAGKRVCLGQELARMEVFLFFTGILQNFCCESLVPREEIDISPKLVGFVSVPHLYEIRFIPR